MTSTSRSRIVALAHGTLLLAFAPSLAAGLTPDESRAVAVLTTRFETVIFAAGRLTSGTVQHGLLGAVDSFRVVASEGRQLLDVVRPDAGRSLAELSTSVLVGAKDFRAPSGPPPHLGGVRSTKCFIFSLRPGARYDAHAWLASAVRVPEAPSVWTWKAPQQEGEPESVSFFGANAGATHFVLTNDLDELRAVVGLLVGSGAGGLPVLHGAQLLDGQSAWAHRRYRLAEATDPMAAGTIDLSPSTTALVVVPDARSNGARLRLHGKPGDAALTTKLNARSRLPAFEETLPGVWESVVVLGRSRDEDGMALLSVWYLLGFGVFL